jgi:hypothetical protein
VFFLSGTAAQVVIGMVISLASIKAYTYFNPFIEDASDMIAEIVQARAPLSEGILVMLCQGRSLAHHDTSLLSASLLRRSIS